MLFPDKAWPFSPYDLESPGRTAKRLLDLAVSASALSAGLPVLAGVALAIWRNMGRPVLFTQERPGYKGRLFTLYKFRTMLPASDDEVWFRTDEERLTPLGRWLRKLSLDELPELWNVFLGEMSLVGPRPLLKEYLPKYTEEENRRHDVKPGITGWAQINGRQDIPFSQRLRLDVWYVDHWSILLDLKILLLTPLVVLKTSGVRPGQNVDEVDDIGLSADRTRTRP